MKSDSELDSELDEMGRALQVLVVNRTSLETALLGLLDCITTSEFENGTGFKATINDQNKARLAIENAREVLGRVK